MPTKAFLKKVRGKDQHDAIKNARKKLPKRYTLRVRTACKAQRPGTWYVQGLLLERAHA